MRKMIRERRPTTTLTGLHCPRKTGVSVVIYLRKNASRRMVKRACVFESAVTISFYNRCGVIHTDSSYSSIWMTPFRPNSKHHHRPNLLHKTEDALHPRCFYIAPEAGDLHEL
jgi:hypothetical protein